MRKMIPINKLSKIERKKMCHYLFKKLIDVQVSELTEKARTDSTGRPGDPDFIFKTQKCNPTAQKNVFDIKIQFLRSAECDHRLKIKTLFSPIMNKF